MFGYDDSMGMIWPVLCVVGSRPEVILVAPVVR